MRNDRVLKGICGLLFSALLLITSVMAEDADKIVFPVSDYTWSLKKPLAGKQNEKNKTGGLEVSQSAMTVDGQEIPALSLVLRKDPGNTLTVSLKPGKTLDMYTQYPTIDVSLWSSLENKCPPCSVALKNKSGQTVSCRGGVYDEKTGFLRFHFDVMRQPGWNRIGDTREIIEFSISFDLGKLPSDRMEVKLGQLSVAGDNFWADRPEQEKKFKEWVHWLDTWQPDFSDSSKYAGAPESGRIAEGLPLTVDGKPNAEIIIRDDPDHIVKNAAEEMQRWFNEISGATIPIVEKAGNMPVKIYLNSEEGEKKFAKDMEYLKPDPVHRGKDGFFVRTSGKSIYIGGPLPKSVLNGVLRFIENNTDLIWAKLNPDFGTVYSRNPNITAVWADAVCKPRSIYRGYQGGQSEWKGRNLLNDRCIQEPKWGSGLKFRDGLLESYLNHDEFAAVIGNPEKGYTRHKATYYGAQACLREEAFQHTLKEMIESIGEHRKKGRYYDIINCGIEDNWNVCCCAECTKPITLPDGTVLTSNKRCEKERMEQGEMRYRSNQYWAFINRLAKEIRKTYPEMRIGTLAYFFMEIAPDFPIESNVYYLFCPLYTRTDFRNPVYAPTNPQIYANRNNLLKRGGHMDLYEYYYFYPVAEVFKEDSLDHLEHGMEGLGFEWSVTSWDFPELQSQDYWVMNRLMWDPGQDVQQLRKYYMRRVYHEAAPAAEKYFLTMLKKHYSGIRGEHGLSWPVESLFKDGRGEEFRNLFADALKKVTNPQARINFGRLVRDYEQRYQAYLNRISGKKKDAGANAAKEKTMALISSSLNGKWSGTFKPCFQGYMTTIEDNGKFYDGLRICAKYEKSKNPVSYTVSCGIRPEKDGERVPLPGKVVFKIKSVVPGGKLHPQPFFAVCSSTGKEYAQVERDYKTIAPGVVQVEFSPSGTIANLDAITGFEVMFNSDIVDPARGYAEFFLYDFEVLPVTLESSEKSRFDNGLE